MKITYFSKYNASVNKIVLKIIHTQINFEKIKVKALIPIKRSDHLLKIFMFIIYKYQKPFYTSGSHKISWLSKINLHASSEINYKLKVYSLFLFKLNWIKFKFHILIFLVESNLIHKINWYFNEKYYKSTNKCLEFDLTYAYYERDPI